MSAFLASAQQFVPVGTKPLSTAAPSFPLAPSEHKLKPSRYWGTQDRVKPTNDWHTNLVLGTAQNPVKTWPYLMRCNEQGITVCYPNQQVQPNSIFDVFLENLSIGALQSLGQRQLVSYGQLHATMRFPGRDDPANSALTIPLVRGQAYVSGFFQNLMPRIFSIHAILSVNGQTNLRPGMSWTAQKFLLRLNNGQTWIIYSQQTQTLVLGNNLTSLQATQNFSGWMRLAILLDPAAEAVLDYFTDVIPTNASVRYEVAMVGQSKQHTTQETFDLGRTIFEFYKYGNQNKPLLMYALPHHQDTLVQPQLPTPRVNISSIKGLMTAIVGDRWVLEDRLTNTGFFAKQAVPEAEMENLRRALRDDANFRVQAKDPYFGGKQVAAMARLALIADQIGDEGIARQVRENMKLDFETWLSPTGANPFVYERTWGGIVSSESAKSWNPDAEFGMGYYNDHHFHFGYHVYAAAVLGLKDKDWLRANYNKFLDLIRDYSNTVSDGYFPQLRMHDVFVGHSFAQGLFEMADIKNMESTSESVNAYYAISLFGRAFGDQNLFNWGRILLANELRSSQKYWHMPSSSKIYPESFKAHKLAGIMWESKVDYTTWFGSNTEFIHCIQMLPFTPITEELLPANFVAEEYPVVATTLNRSDPPLSEGWRGFIYMAHSIFDQRSARLEIEKLKGFDDGNTRSNTLYFVSTRPANRI